MTPEEQKEYEALIEQRFIIGRRIRELNPYDELKRMSNKDFGEKWSESRILSQVPQFLADNSRGHDFIHYILGRIEVKSSRLPCATITYNQCHPDECDYFLFVNYDTIKGTEEVFLVPSYDLVDNCIFSITKQHSQDGGCYSVSGSTRKNRQALANYRIGTLADLRLYMENKESENPIR